MVHNLHYSAEQEWTGHHLAFFSVLAENSLLNITLAVEVFVYVIDQIKGLSFPS